MIYYSEFEIKMGSGIYTLYNYLLYIKIKSPITTD